MKMRWMDNLKGIAEECKKGKYEFPEYLDMEEHKRSYDYYMDQLLMYEEELTYKQAEDIEKQLEIFKATLKKQYPEINL